MTHSAFFCRLYRFFCRLCYFFCRLCCLTLRCSLANHSCCLSLLSGCFRALSSLTPLRGRTQLLRLGILCGLLYNLYFPALLGFIDRCFYFSLLLSSLRRLILSSCLPIAAVLRLSQCLLILSAFLFRRFLSLGLLNHSLIAAYLCVLPRVPATGLLSAFTLPGMSLSAVLRLAFSCLTLSSTL